MQRKNVAYDVIGGSSAWLIWLIATIFVIYQFSLNTGYVVFQSDIAESFSLNISEIALLGSFFFYGFVLTQLFSGALLDRYGPRFVLSGAILLISSGVLLFSNSDTINLLYFSRVLMGMGASFGFVGVGFITGIWFPGNRFTLIFGLVQTAASLFSAFNLITLNYILKNWLWMDVLTVLGVFGLLLSIVTVFIVRSPRLAKNPQEKSISNDSAVLGLLSQIFKVIINPKVLLVSVIGAGSMGALLSIALVWGAQLMISKGFSAEQGTYLSAIIWLGLASGALLVAQTIRWLNSMKKALTIFLSIELLAVLAIIYLDGLSYGLWIVLFFLFGVGSGSQMLAFTLSTVFSKPYLHGTAMAVVNLAMFLMSGILMSLPGSYLADKVTLVPSDFYEPLMFIPLSLLAALIIGLILPIPKEEKY